MDEHIAGRAVRRQAALGRYITSPTAINLALLKHGAGIAEDKINVSFNQAIPEVLASGSGVQSVLPAHEPALLKDSAVGIHGDGHCLGARPMTVFKSNIRGLKLRALYLDCAAEKRSANLLRTGVEGNHSGCCISAQERDTWPVLGDFHALPVSAGPDLDDQTLFRL